MEVFDKDGGGEVMLGEFTEGMEALGQMDRVKQVEAIGKTGRNWPIRDGKAQVDAISKSIKSAGQTSSTPDANGKPKGPHDVIMISLRPAGKSSR